jgi:hypothetical protein
METKSNQQKRTNLNMRGQKGSAEVRHVYPVIDLNWLRMRERVDNRGRYYPNAKEDLRPAVIEEPLGLGCGPVQGYRIVVRGSPEYRF